MKKLLASAALAAALCCAAVPVAAQNVICPTAPLGTSDNRCASTAFVQAGFSNLLATANVWLAQQTFNVSPLVPTAAPGDSSTKAASTAFVQAAVANAAVTSFNSRTGAVLPQTGDYSFSQISGVAATSQGGLGADKSGAAANTVQVANGSGSFITTAIYALLDTVCSLSPSTCSSFFGYYRAKWYGAVCNGATDDHAAIQAALDAAYAANGGGEVRLAAGNCIVLSTLTIKQRVTLVGVAGTGTTVNSNDTNITVINITNPASTNWGGGFSDLHIIGKVTGTPTVAAVIVDATSVGALIKDCQISGGTYALQMQGGDGFVTDCFIMGLVGGINNVNTGGEYYVRLKLDTGGTDPHSYGMLFNGAGTAEVHMLNSDISGDFTASLSISGPTVNGDFTGVVFSSPVVVGTAGNLGFVNSAFGGNVTVSGTVRIGISAGGGGGITATGATCAGNTGITC